MLCPECHGEYRRGITQCAICDVALVERLTEELPHPDPQSPAGPADAARPGRVEHVDLIGYVDLDNARAARAKLKEAGIPCELVVREIEPSPHETAAPQATAAADEFWVRVPGAHAGAANDLLLDDFKLADDACPSCGGALDARGECAACLSTHQPL